LSCADAYTDDPLNVDSIPFTDAGVGFEACEGSYTAFLGAVRTPAARECVTLGIRSNVHPEVESHRIAIGTGARG
jgi:hypothetical protein